jgi:UDP:flavonoid glycosyltransferase YjiC (YdhE family)
LFSTIAAAGHFHPVVPLARALQEAGHVVAFAARPALRARVEAAGFPALEVGGDTATDPEYRAVKARLRTLPLSLASELYAYPRLFAGIGARVRAPYLVEAANAWQADMLIREAGEYAALIVAEHLGLPYATVSFAAALRGMSIFEREVASELAPVREQWGLSPDPKGEALYRYLNLSFSPPSFATQDVGWKEPAGPIPATTHFIRPEFFDNTSGESLPEWVTQLPTQPTVYVTLGTEVNGEPELYPSVMRTIIEGLRDAPLNLIVTIGRDKDPADIGPQPPNVRIERYIPQTLLLPHCDVIVMHAGSNSLLMALEAGLPLVLTPLIADQFFNAYVAEKLGLAPVVRRESLTTTSIRAAVDEVLANAVYRQNIARVQAEMRMQPGMGRAVELVEQVARGQRPANSH